MAVQPSAEKARSLYEQLRDQLLAGEHTPGTRLSELVLVRTFGVSRTPARDALVRLEHDGLLTRVDGSFTIPVRGVEEILDLYEARATIAGLLARSASERRTQADVFLLERANRVARELDPATSSPQELTMSNRAFHAAVGDASHNPVLVDLQRRLDFRVANLPATTLTHDGRWLEAVQEHETITAAIEARDADRAAFVGEAHIRAARTIWLERMRHSSDRS